MLVRNPEGTPETELPRLYQDRAFWGIAITQFLGAFNDNLYKQLILLLSVPIGVGAVQLDQQGLATVIFALPFVLGSGYAGYLSDKWSKRFVIVAAKVAEIVIMLMGLIGFLGYGATGYSGLLVVLFLMGSHSTFFGPAKYGILPELFREEDLPRANGFILMTTFLAIIFGTAIAGLLKTWLVPAQGGFEAGPQRLAYGSLVCIGIAILGTVTSLLLRATPPAQPNLRFTWQTLAIRRESVELLVRDGALWHALLASCVFWLVSGITIQAVNSLGLRQLKLNEFWTSVLTAFIAVGIMAGALLASWLCRRWPHGRVVTVGAWAMAFCSLALSLARGNGDHLLGFGGSVPILIGMGMAAGMFAIPVQVFIQSRPPRDQKGRMIAVMNQLNFIAILLSGIVYWIADRVIIARDWPRCYVFLIMASCLVPLAACYQLPPSTTLAHEP